eukprot:1160935-Pelagomonas_calceolata.AAC.5
MRGMDWTSSGVRACMRGACSLGAGGRSLDDIVGGVWKQFGLRGLCAAAALMQMDTVLLPTHRWTPLSEKQDCLASCDDMLKGKGRNDILKGKG